MELKTMAGQMTFFAPQVLIIPSDWPNDYQEQFWCEYPRKISKRAAMKAMEKAKDTDVKWEKLIGGVRKYKIWLSEAAPGIWRPEPKHPATWLNGGCWDDEFTPDAPRPKENWQQTQDDAESFLRRNRERAIHGRGENAQGDRAAISGPAVSRSDSDADSRAMVPRVDPRSRNVHKVDG